MIFRLGHVRCILLPIEARTAHMVDGSSDSTPPITTSTTSQPPAVRFAPGDRIRIATGKLSGLTGKVASLRDHSNCVLTIDAWTDGVYAIVSSQSLERL
jgi:hypothetical protein